MIMNTFFARYLPMNVATIIIWYALIWYTLIWYTFIWYTLICMIMIKITWIWTVLSLR